MPKITTPFSKDVHPPKHLSFVFFFDGVMCLYALKSGVGNGGRGGPGGGRNDGSEPNG